MSVFKSYKYKNLSLLFLSIFLAFILSRFEPFHRLLLSLGGLGYIGIFFAGALFASSFTISIGIVVLLVLSKNFSPIEIGLIGGLGAVISDFIIFRFVKENLSIELERIYEHFDPRHHFKHVLHSKYFSWTTPLVGALIIASPLPDELGVSLLGLSKMRNYQFMLISFILNAIGITAVIYVSSFLKP
ncbi:MAG: hypothetical protein KBD51_03540 [Candidatus Levybacteria bacterium]|nr:hypothetical protein [Candidatus Levybacteria bacterium]